MDCPICFESITAATGVVTTSCGHSYHFACISGWFMKQENGSCPCCRKEMGATEDFPQGSEDDEDESDDEDDSDDEDEDDYSDDEDDEEEVEFERAELDVFLRKRGGVGLTNAIAAEVCPVLCGLTRMELHFLCIGNGARPITDDDWTMLFEKPSLQIHLLLVDGQWTRTVMNPEDIVLAVTLTEGQDAATEANAAALKVQSLWRGFKSRHVIRA
jgi:hypothetical protein